MAARRLITAILCAHIPQLPQSKKQELLCEAIRNHSKEILKLLLISSDINSNKYYTFLLHLVAKQGGDVEIVEMLLDRGADINAKDINGWTPLHNAARYSRKTVEMLLDRGADINAKTEDSSTPLYFAAQCGKTEIVEILLDRGADM